MSKEHNSESENNALASAISMPDVEYRDQE